MRFHRLLLLLPLCALMALALSGFGFARPQETPDYTGQVLYFDVGIRF